MLQQFHLPMVLAPPRSSSVTFQWAMLGVRAGCLDLGVNLGIAATMPEPVERKNVHFPAGLLNTEEVQSILIAYIRLTDILVV